MGQQVNVYRELSLKIPQALVKAGTAYEALANIIDGYGVNLAQDYGAALSNRTYAMSINADTGSTDMTGDTMTGAIRGRTVVGTTQTNCSLHGIQGNIDVGTVSFQGNIFAVAGVMDCYGDTTMGSGAAFYGGAANFTIWNEATTTVGAGGVWAGVDILQNSGKPTLGSGAINPAIHIRSSSSSTVWSVGIDINGCARGINFDGVVPPAGAGNYGQTLDCTWLAVDPGSGGSFGAKLMFSNTDTSLNPLYGLGLRCRSYAAGAIAVGLNVSASAAIASSGQLLGGQFYLQNSGSYTIVGVYESTALYCKSWLTAACSPSASALWIDDESSTKATAQYMVDITMNGSVEIDNVFHIYGGDPGADTFINFDTCDQGTGAFVAANTTAVASLTNTHRIKCLVNGTTTGYIHLFSN